MQAGAETTGLSKVSRRMQTKRCYTGGQKDAACAPSGANSVNLGAMVNGE